MLLVVDIGNTQIQLGAFEGETLRMNARLSTGRRRTEEEYALQLEGAFRLHHLDPSAVDGVIISSVVPPVTGAFCRAIGFFTSAQPMVVGPGIKTGFRIRIDNPAQLGSDMVAAAAGALAAFTPPLMIIDLGTAVTMTALSGKGEVLGVAIAPGVQLSLEALSAGTAQLPFIPLEDTRRAIGTNTVDSMKAGVVLGTASLLDGMMDRFAAEMGEIPRVIATGDLAGTILPHCTHPVEVRPFLLLEGLRVLYERNVIRPL